MRGYLGEFEATVGLVLGSGLGGFVDLMHVEESIDFADIEGLPQSAVRGHTGRILFGILGRTPLIVLQGRVHLYEGWAAREVTAGIRFLAECGIERLILTNAAGSLNDRFEPGDWMMVSDHLNLTATSPLGGASGFLAMDDAYSPLLRRRFRETARRLKLTLHEGVYAGVRGPQYETPAEIRMLRALGADAVGMSTVLETIQARALGIEVAAFSCLTNWGAGLGRSIPSHQEVLDAGERATGALGELLASAQP